jgi:rapamycin-insensitive companion of mTOR
MRWVRLACSLITTLVTSPEGIRFLAGEDSLLPQLAVCFTELLPVRYPSSKYPHFYLTVCSLRQFQGAPALDPIFSAKRMENTLTCGYFDIIGVLSKYPEGVEYVRGGFS